MSNIRDIVRRHVITETEKELKNQGVETTTIPVMLEFLAKRGELDRKVDGTLNAFRDEIELNSPKKRKEKLNKFAFTSISSVLTILIAVATNNEWWIIVAGLAIIYIGFSAYFIYFDN